MGTIRKKPHYFAWVPLSSFLLSLFLLGTGHDMHQFLEFLLGKFVILLKVCLDRKFWRERERRKIEGLVSPCLDITWREGKTESENSYFSPS